MTGGLGWGGAWRLARRDLQSRLRGLRLLFVCLLLGVTTLAAIGSLTAAITSEIDAQGQTILGGDVEVSMAQREATPDERQTIAEFGTVSTTIRMQAMAQRDTPPRTAGTFPNAVLTELKGVDSIYPLYGALTLANGQPAPELGTNDLLIAPALVDRLGVRVGDQIRFGSASFTIRGIIGTEPDRVGEGFTLGPVALTSLAGVRRSGLILPGSMYETKYRIRMVAGSDAEAATDAIKDAFPDASFSARSRDNAAPGASRFISRMGQFLTLIGLAALVIAGIGVGNGVTSYLTAKRGALATLKVLGASSADVARIMALQVGAVTGLAVIVGLVLGAALPPLLILAIGDALPVEPGWRLHPIPLLTSAAYGILIAAIFTWPPLRRAGLIPPAALFRDGGGDPVIRPWPTRFAVGVLLAILLAIAIGTARDPLFSASVLGAVAAVVGLLALLAVGIRKSVARLPRPRDPLWRLAVTNLHRPGSQTGALVVALGLALTLFVTLAAIQTGLTAEIRKSVPRAAPDQFVLDIPVADRAAFLSIVSRQLPKAEVTVAPTLRGRIIAYGKTRVSELEELPEGAWFLRGERPVTYSEALPSGSTLTAGQWWAKDYAGPPLVSLDQEAATVMGVSVGDSITMNLLGRDVTARIASLRQIDWDTMGFNYIVVFSPGTLKDAPHSLAAAISVPDGLDAGAATPAILARFPSASVIAVKDVLTQVSTLLGQMAQAILAASAVAIAAGIAVLVGAIAAARQSRAYDSVIMKVLGASRRQILSVQIAEYGLLSATLALLALGLGVGAAWAVMTQVFEFGFSPDWIIVLATLIGGGLLTLGIGLIGSLPLLRVQPAQALRSL